jgi:replication factor C small subunit
MATVFSKLLTERVRPKEFSQLIMLNRIEKIIGGGELSQNLLLEGTAGTGKTTAARILAKGHDTLYVNTSSERGIETLKGDIVEFCGTRSFGDFESEQKVVILDEIDGATEMFFKALRATMEKYQFVRFIATCNYIQKLPDPVQSRFLVLNFDPKNQTEENELKEKYAKRVRSITKKLGIEWESPEVLTTFVDKNFPDLRRIVSKIQEYQVSGITKVTLEDVKLMHFTFRELFELAVNKTEPEIIYKTIMSEYTNKVDEVLTSFANDFGDWLRENRPNLTHKLAQTYIYIADYEYKKNFIIDKHLTLLALLFSIQNYMVAP